MLFMIESIRSLRAAITSLALAASCALDRGGRASDIATQPIASPAYAARLRRDSMGRRPVTLHLRAGVCAGSSFADLSCCRSLARSDRAILRTMMLQRMLQVDTRPHPGRHHGSLGGRWLPGPAPARYMR